MLCGGGDPESRQEAEGAEKRGKESKKDRPRGGTDHRARQDGGTHAHTHTHAHAHMHTRDAHAHSALAHTRSTHAHAHAAHARMYTHTHMCTRTHARMQTRTHMPRSPSQTRSAQPPAPRPSPQPGWPACGWAERSGSPLCPFVLGSGMDKSSAPGRLLWLATSPRSPSSPCKDAGLLHNRPKNNPRAGGAGETASCLLGPLKAAAGDGQMARGSCSAWAWDRLEAQGHPGCPPQHLGDPPAGS